ncbi:helicase-related protein [Natronorubrum daqingense]|uniref:Helicase SNF2 n=1 Tax=Natronorubrum daqingense TaxID=588898 RepID=A0A1N7E672_9EURY|nr:helicase-related protein [Natronorubrum daqingense]APX96384.1 helicase SNF2 [Natronorubrum daqingense]SIR83571.1 Type III restriction enzyme, res subunit [Natronorubrum daqingense]
MLSLDPIVDNTDSTLEETYRKVVPLSEEIRISTGYFYLSGFDLVSEDLDQLADPETLGRSPMRVLMGRKTDRRTASEIEEGFSLREQFREELQEDIEGLNRAQIERLDRLRDFIANDLIDVRVRVPEDGYFHAKGACFRAPPDSERAKDHEEDKRGAVTIVGSSNFSASGQRRNVELNMTSQDRREAEAFEEWYDNQWANAEEFSEDIVEVIETSDKYQEWREKQRAESESDQDEGELGTYLEPFELYKLLAYDELGGNVSSRDSPLYHFQRLGYESAKEKLSTYNGCIISDSVGLGKSFIGSELLYDYRHRGDSCLLIVPANLTDQWEHLLQNETDEDGDPFFGLEVDGAHLEVISISDFQNRSYEEVQKLREAFDVVLIDEAHRFRNSGKWRPNPSHDDDYKGTRRHANLRQLRGKTMIMLTATPINNSATDLRNLISLFTSKEELRNKSSLDFDAFAEYIDLADQRKRIVAGNEEADEETERRITEQLQRRALEISDILNEVMVLRTRKHVKDEVQDGEEFEMSFEPPRLSKEEYSLPTAYQPIYRMLPDVMDALHLPHITIKNPQGGSTLKALYKLNLLKRLESSTYAFVQSLETLHESERRLLGLLDGLPEDEDIDALRSLQEEENASTLEDFVEGKDAATDLEETLEEFGFDTGVVRAGETDAPDELADATVREVKRYIREDLTLLAYFLSQFIGDVAHDAGDVSDHAVETRSWLHEHGAGTLPEVPEEERDPVLYPDNDLSNVDGATREFYESVFSLRKFRDPKIDRLAEILGAYDKKTLVFTQYRGTAEYVHRALREDPESPLTDANSAVVKGGDENKRAVVKRFAPEASGYQQTLAESDESELQYVVATDTLSEGVNLQDVNVVVNYDLPWNPMRIVQRVGRVDRIGSTAEKYVHNFYPDGDIEAAIKLLERLQAKINDIALIVGKENNILDPNEDQILEQAGVETQKTIGELEVEEIERSLRESRDVEDINELDDTSVNPLLRNAGSDEQGAFQRFRLKHELNEEFGLSTDDFEFAEEYFDSPVGERGFLYTNAVDHERGPRPGVFGLAHLWFDEEDDAPLGRVRRAFYYKPFGDDVKERPVRMLGLTPAVDGDPITDEDRTDRVLTDRGQIEDVVDARLEEIRDSQVEGAYLQGGQHSKEQETLISFCQQYVEPRRGDDPDPSGEYDTIEDRSRELRGRLSDVGLKNTDEDRVLREKFRDDAEYDALTEWPVEEFLGTLEAFLEEYVDGSTEYQDTLVGESEVRARLVCWGVIGS